LSAISPAHNVSPFSLSEDFKPPYGFPLFWPFPEAYFFSSWPILPNVERNFLSPGIGIQITRVCSFESLFILPFLFFPLEEEGLSKEKRIEVASGTFPNP
jgi:hypothetical protein